MSGVGASGQALHDSLAFDATREAALRLGVLDPFLHWRSLCDQLCGWLLCPKIDLLVVVPPAFRPNLIERAFEIAHEGHARNVAEIASHLAREGYFGAAAQLRGRSIRKQLLKLVSRRAAAASW